jgi:hypothetical protein
MGGRVVGAFAAACLAALTGCSPNSDGANVADSSGPLTVTSPPATTGIREPTFGLDAEVDGYLLEVSEVTNVGGQGIDIDVTRAGAPVTSVRGDAAHVFAIGPDMSFFQHDVSPADQVMSWLRSWQNINDTGTSRVMVMFDDRDGPVVLGTDVVVREESDFGGAMIVGIDGSYRIQSGVVVERDGWDFTLAVPWGGGSAAGDAAWLTLVRRSDLALTFDVAELATKRPMASTYQGNSRTARRHSERAGSTRRVGTGTAADWWTHRGWGVTRRGRVGQRSARVASTRSRKSIRRCSSDVSTP